MGEGADPVGSCDDSNRDPCIDPVPSRHAGFRIVTFFESLTKPDWIPPDWAFPAVWFTLWGLQLVALFVLLENERSGRVVALGFLAAQFVVAVLWQAVVFGPGRLTLAAWWLVAVLVLVVASVVSAWRVSGLAAALIPTIVWVSIATALGFSLLRLNPTA